MVAEFLETMIGTGSERSKYEEYVEKFSTMYEEEGAFDGEYDELQEYLNEVNIQKIFCFAFFHLYLFLIVHFQIYISEIL
jgi:hypothetical protein